MAVVAAVADWLLYLVWRSPNRDDWSTYGAFAVSVEVIVVGWVVMAWRKGKGDPPADEVGRKVAAQIGHDREGMLRGPETDPQQLGVQAAINVPKVPPGHAEREEGWDGLIASAQPRLAEWVAAVYASPTSSEPLGCGVVLDDQRILTCGDVVERLVSGDRSNAGRKDFGRADGMAVAWIGFPMAEFGADPDVRFRVVRVVLPESRSTEDRDLAILVLAEDAPSGVPAAPLRCPRPAELVGKRWWAYGFPPGNSKVGGPAAGHVEGQLARGWVRLSKASGRAVEGFYGGGLWSPDDEAVVGIIARPDPSTGNGRVISLYQAVDWFPGENLRLLAERFPVTAAGKLALSAWNWSLAEDLASTRHWRPRARGVADESEPGFRFRGRTAALLAIKSWLERETVDQRVLVVTGAPGAGKSAVLGRIVTTADVEVAKELPASDMAVRASLGSVSCAVHANRLSALDVAVQIATAASAARPQKLEDFPHCIRSALKDRVSQRFNVIIDALDESEQARLIVDKVILPLTQCWEFGAQVVVGSRRSDAFGYLLAARSRINLAGGRLGVPVSSAGVFGGAEKILDLDDPDFFAVEDLASYALATLQLVGHERPGNPYASQVVASPVAERIAAISDGNFLVAMLTALNHGQFDEVAIDPLTLSFSPKVEDAMRDYLARVPPPVQGISAEALLTALAFADSPGMPVSLWQIAVQAMDSVNVPQVVLSKFARSSAASFLIESFSSYVNKEEIEFRLFHQALIDALRHGRAALVEEHVDEQSLAQALMAAGQQAGWDQAPTYLRRSLPGHAARAGILDDLLADDDYLLYADLLRLQSVSSRAVSALARQQAQLLRLVPSAAFAAEGPSRAAIFTVTEALEDLPVRPGRSSVQGPYQAAWAVAPRSVEHTVLRGHNDQVNAVCELAGQLVTADDDGTIRIWNPDTGNLASVLTGHIGAVLSVCTFKIGKNTYLASGGDDKTVRIWNPRTSNLVHTLDEHEGRVKCVCALADESGHVASGSDDGTARIWDADTGTLISTLAGHDGEVNAVCAFAIDGTTHLVTGSSDWRTRIWSPHKTSPVYVLKGHRQAVTSICGFSMGETNYLATGSSDKTVRIWNPVNKNPHIRALTGHTAGITAVCALPISGAVRLASGSSDGTILLWNPKKRNPLNILTGHISQISSLCELTTTETSARLASASNDRTTRIWNPGTTDETSPPVRHTAPVNAVCTVVVGGTTRLATGSSDWTVRIWDPATGTALHQVKGQNGEVNALCAFSVGETNYLASASSDQTVRIYDPDTGDRIKTLSGHEDSVNSVCVIKIRDVLRLASGSSDQTVRIWDPATGDTILTLECEEQWVQAVCALSTRLVSSDGDKNVWMWNAADGRHVGTLTGHEGRVRSICAFTVGKIPYLAVGGDDRTVRIWKPFTDDLIRTFTEHSSSVTAICAITHGATTHLATASSDATVRIWNPASDSSELAIPTRDPALSVAWDENLEMLFIGTGTGILAVRLNAEFFRQAAIKRKNQSPLLLPL